MLGTVTALILSHCALIVLLIRENKGLVKSRSIFTKHFFLLTMLLESYSCLVVNYKRIKYFYIVIASDPALAGERGNPMRLLHGVYPEQNNQILPPY